MYDFKNFKEKTSSIEEWLHKEYLSIRTGRATPTLLDSITVDSYGSFMPIKHVANISIEDPKTLRISPWDKAQVRSVEQALRASNMGVSIAVDDQGIRVGFPDLTEETRKQIVKIVREKLEDARVSLRKERERVQDEINAKEKNGEISEDDKFRAKEELQKLVDATGRSLELIASKKEEEIMTI